MVCGRAEFVSSVTSKLFADASSDMTECVPDFEFAPQRTFTVADAVRASGKGYFSHFGGKWHLGSLYNDSEALGGITSSPVTHGFDVFNATVEVSPTATTNCQCNAAWQPDCDYGHYGKMTHCSGGPGPDPNASAGVRGRGVASGSPSAGVPTDLPAPPPSPCSAASTTGGTTRLRRTACRTSPRPRPTTTRRTTPTRSSASSSRWGARRSSRRCRGEPEEEGGGRRESRELRTFSGAIAASARLSSS